MEFNLRIKSHNLEKGFGKSPSQIKVFVSIKPWMKGWPDYCLDVLQIDVDGERFVQERRNSVNWSSVAVVGDVNAIKKLESIKSVSK